MPRSSMSRHIMIYACGDTTQRRTTAAISHTNVYSKTPLARPCTCAATTQNMRQTSAGRKKTSYTRIKTVSRPHGCYRNSVCCVFSNTHLLRFQMVQALVLYDVHIGQRNWNAYTPFGEARMNNHTQVRLWLSRYIRKETKWINSRIFADQSYEGYALRGP